LAVSVPVDRPDVRAAMPRPLLSQRAEERLGSRHREVLDALERLFIDEGFAGISVRELAAHVGCSRRTLYEIAPSKDELVLVVLDRFLHRVGRTALDAIGEGAGFAARIRAYFLGGVELQRLSQAFADDLADEPAVRRLFDRHFRYVMAVTEELVAAGIAAGEFRPVTPAVVAGVLAGSGLYFNQVEITAGDPVGEMLDLIIESISRS
jgi:AcrR family transcriptional regulator